MKDIDSFARTQYLSMYIRGLLYCLIMGGLLSLIYGWIALVIAVSVSFILPFPAMYATGRIADFFIFLYSGGSRSQTLHEQLAGELDRIRHLKQARDFRGAVAAADAVLARIPEHPEALLLKAEILFREFEQCGAANACLKKVIDAKPVPDETVRQWAVNLHEEISAYIRQRADRNT